ncbi:MAG: DUF4274 domain-containing protein [Hyphomonadaceae bacterium]
MLAEIISRLVQPGRHYDHLFTAFAPSGAPPQVLSDIFHQHDDAFADEYVPPQHRFFRALVQDILAGRQRNFSKLDGPALKRIYSAYAACFERAETYEFQLALWRNDPPFRLALSEARQTIITELVAKAAQDQARRAYYSRWKECLQTPLDIGGATLAALLRQMSPDDWHEIALNWNWGDGLAPLAWITARHDCDRATAVYAMCAGAPGDVAESHRSDNRQHGFVRDVAARLEGGFYPNAELALALGDRTRLSFAREIARARATGESPWLLPDDLLTHEGVRTHAPKYSVTNGTVHYQYDYWLAHRAPKR